MAVAGGDPPHAVERAVLAGNLADRGGARKAVEQAAHAGQHAERLRLHHVVQMALHSEELGRHAARRTRGGRVGAQLRVVQHEVDGIEAESIHAAAQPELAALQDRVHYVGVVQVQRRLLGEEVVQVVLPPPRLPRPGGAAEHREPVVGRRAVRLRIGPDIPVAIAAVAAGAAVEEPRVAVGGVAPDLVDQHLQAERMGAVEQPVEIGERAEQRIDRDVVGHVIAEIGLRRAEERAEPDRVGAERGHVVELRGHARQVADAVAVAVEEAARIDLVDDGAAPPVVRLHRPGSPRGRVYELTRPCSTRTCA